jgi:hypothetical protein
VVAIVLISVVAVGLAVFVHEVATHHYAVDGYLATKDGGLTITYTYGECENVRKGSLVEETSERVVVGVTYIPDLYPGICTLIGYEGSATFKLQEPLGDRPVYYDDGAKYHEVPLAGHRQNGLH